MVLTEFYSHMECCYHKLWYDIIVLYNDWFSWFVGESCSVKTNQSSHLKIKADCAWFKKEKKATRTRFSFVASYDSNSYLIDLWRKKSNRSIFAAIYPMSWSISAWQAWVKHTKAKEQLFWLEFLIDSKKQSIKGLSSLSAGVTQLKMDCICGANKRENWQVVKCVVPSSWEQFFSLGFLISVIIIFTNS